MSFRLAVGLSVLIKLFVLPEDDLDLEIVPILDDRLLFTDQDIGVQLALRPPAGAIAPQPENRRAIMAFWNGSDRDAPSLELIARSDLPDELVYRLTRAIMEHGVFLSRLEDTFWDITTERALQGLTTPLHSGAVLYYEEIGVIGLPPSEPLQALQLDNRPNERMAAVSTFLIYFEPESSSIDAGATAQIAAACDYAVSANARAIQIIAPTEEQDLMRRRVEAITQALQQNSACGGNDQTAVITKTRSILPNQIADAIDFENCIEVTVVSRDSRLVR